MSSYAEGSNMYMLRRANSQNHHTKDSQCAALSCILQLSSTRIECLFRCNFFSQIELSEHNRQRFSGLCYHYELFECTNEENNECIAKVV